MTALAPSRQRLLDAAAQLLVEHPEVEPTTRELCEAAGVGAPTLYHHFGDKNGLIDAVLDEAFDAYLHRKHAVPRSTDLIADFAAGWDMHVQFGLDNPVLYRIMYGLSGPRRGRAAGAAEAALLEDMNRLDDSGLLRMSPKQAVDVTLASSIGCVMQLLRTRGSTYGSVSRAMRDSLIAALTGLPPSVTDTKGAARQLLATLAQEEEPLQAAEIALLRQWLATLAT